MAEEKFEDYVYLNKICLSSVGLWPLADGVSKWRLYLNNFHIFITYALFLLVMLIPEALDLYMVWGNIDAIVENVCVNIYLASAAIKFYQMIVKKKTFKDLLNIMKRDWDSTVHKGVSKDRRNILLRYASFSQNLTKIFALLAYVICTQLFLLPLIFGMNNNPIRKRWYPSSAWYYFDQSSDSAYACFYCLQLFIGVGLGISVNIGLDSFCCVAISHICAQLIIFQKELLELGKHSKVSQGIIKQIIQKHNHQFRVTQLLNEIFNNISLCQLLLSCVAICTAGFQLIISLEVGNAAYQSLWTNLPTSSCKEIKLLILRSQRPMFITAGKMYILSLSRFIAILKTSMQCLSYLRASYNHKDRLGQ
ncbi:odorant receptor 13a-like [Belonocnema kinseyi]|uniref:odorant receptor 13a-like n=1 Tax=Belonocnema kinseyi TaxID=2817044 RepID=UPI00143CE994|nr:odorant receptor 13a-like [Belonocnema kinseyi]